MVIDWQVVPLDRNDRFLMFLNEGTISYVRLLTYYREQMPTKDEVMSYLISIAEAVVSSKEPDGIPISSIEYMRTCESMAESILKNPDAVKKIFEKGFLARPISGTSATFLRCDVRERSVANKKIPYYFESLSKNIRNKPIEYILGFPINNDCIDEEKTYELFVKKNKDVSRIIDFSISKFSKKDLGDVILSSSKDAVVSIGDDLLYDAAAGYESDKFLHEEQRAKKLYEAKLKMLYGAHRSFSNFSCRRSQ